MGVTNDQLEDKQTAEFIYDFVEKHGGIEEANRQLERQNTQLTPPRPSHRGGGRGGNRKGRGLPPPPPSGDRAPPPPVRSAGPPPPGNVPPPPPPPPIGAPAPLPPPPPVSGGSSGPPPPPMKPGGSGPPPPAAPDARGNLLSSIRAGVHLKTVRTCLLLAHIVCKQCHTHTHRGHMLMTMKLMKKMMILMEWLELLLVLLLSALMPSIRVVSLSSSSL